MAYVLTIYNANNEFQGFVHVPRRGHPNPQFVTQQPSKAERYPTREKANTRSMRFNSMNEPKGLVTHVVAANPQNGIPFEQEEA